MTHTITYNSYTIPLAGKSFTNNLDALKTGLVDRSFDVTFDIEGTSEADLADKINTAKTALTQINKDLKVTIGGTDIIDWEYASIGKPITTGFRLDSRIQTAYTRSATFSVHVESEGGGSVTPLISSQTNAQYNTVGLMTVTETRTEKVTRTEDNYIDGETHLATFLSDNSLPPSGFEILGTPTFDIDNIKNRISFSVTYIEIKIGRPAPAGFTVKDYNYNISVRWVRGTNKGNWYQYQITGSMIIDKVDRTSHPITDNSKEQSPDLTTRSQQKIVEDALWEAWNTWVNAQATYYVSKNPTWDVGNRLCSFSFLLMRFEISGNLIKAPKFLTFDVSRSEVTDYGIETITVGQFEFFRKIRPETQRVTISASGQVLQSIPSKESIEKFAGGTNNLKLISKDEKFFAPKYMSEEWQSQQFSSNYQYRNINNKDTGAVADSPITSTYQNKSRA